LKTWRLKESAVAASFFGVLAGSTAWAQQAAPPGELEALKRMVEEALSQNEELRKRVRELEEAIGKPQQPGQEAPKGTAKEPAKEAPKETAQEPAKKAAEEAAEEPVGKAKGLRIGDKVQLQFGGAVEIGARWSEDFARSRQSSLTLDTAEIDFEVRLSDWAKADVAFEWDSGADKLTVNEALVTFGEHSWVSLKAGRGTVPFGLSTGGTVAAKLEDTLTLTDPLTIAVFDGKEDFALLKLEYGGFHADVYVYNGQTNRRTDKKLEHYGAAIGYSMKGDTVSLAAGVSMIDSVFDSDGLAEAYPEALTLRRYVPGLAAHAKLGFRGFSLVMAHYQALRRARFSRLDEDGEVVRTFHIRPQAWHLEAGYLTQIFGQKTFGAFGYSQSYDLAGAFPETRKIATVGTWLLEDLRLTFDYAHDVDYRTAVGGTGRSANTFTLRLTYEW
jgi:hypothetical protein